VEVNMNNSKDTNEKQNLKSQRVRSYFIQAAKDIILEEGVENVSVRKVADSAGYTFSTIYNYYGSQNELLQDVKAEMIKDLIQYMQETFPKKISSINDLKKQQRLYVDYFINNPNVFSFFYSYRLHPVQKESGEIMDFSSQYIETYRVFAENRIIQESEIADLAKTFVYSLHGLLALYFSDNGMSAEILYEEIDRVADFLLRERKTS
jgi:AcrR family transcriptional regulator